MEYTILIHKDVEGGWYCGQCQQLPGAISEGKTLDELMENMKDAIQLVLEYNKEQALQAFKANGSFTGNWHLHEKEFAHKAFDAKQLYLVSRRSEAQFVC